MSLTAGDHRADPGAVNGAVRGSVTGVRTLPDHDSDHLSSSPHQPPRRRVEAVAPPPLERLDISHFEALLADEPELLILGTGERNVFPPRELTFAFARRGIGLEVMDTAAAARTFNVLAGEGRRLAAVLYL